MPFTSGELTQWGASQPRAAHLRVADALIAKIHQGVYGPGETLPSSAKLAREHGVSETTMSKVMTRLIAQKYVAPARRGRKVVAAELPALLPEPREGE
jgi:GntR family transcriptional regulator